MSHAISDVCNTQLTQIMTNQVKLVLKDIQTTKQSTLFVPQMGIHKMRGHSHVRVKGHVPFLV